MALPVCAAVGAGAIQQGAIWGATNMGCVLGGNFWLSDVTSLLHSGPGGARLS